MTKVEVYNLALDLVRETAAVSVDDARASVRFLNRNFDHTVRTSMRAYPWGFAKELHELSADATNPPFKWSRAYSIPAGVLRTLPITRYGNRYGDQVPHEIVGNKIYTDENAPLRVTFIMDRSTNPGLWDDLFVEYVRSALALGMANKITGKSRYIEIASQMFNAAREQAEMIEAYEGTPEPVENFDILRVRGSDADVYRRRW